MNVETANRLMQLRKKAGLSQEELADKLGVSRQAVSKWECAESSPDTDNLIALSKLYGVTLDELVNGTDTKEEAPKEKEPFLHIKDKDGSEIRIENAKVHITSDDGDEVHISTDGVKIKKEKSEAEEEEEKFMESDEKYYVGKEMTKMILIQRMVSSIIPLLVIVAYLILGFTLPDGWRNYWILFFLIPIMPSLFKAISKKRFCIFAYPVLVVMVYLGLGMFLSIWHPTWLMFLSIPLYYSITGPIDAYIHHAKKMKEKVIDVKVEDKD